MDCHYSLNYTKAHFATQSIKSQHSSFGQPFPITPLDYISPGMFLNSQKNTIPSPGHYTVAHNFKRIFGLYWRSGLIQGSKVPTKSQWRHSSVSVDMPVTRKLGYQDRRPEKNQKPMEQSTHPTKKNTGINTQTYNHSKSICINASIRIQ